MAEGKRYFWLKLKDDFFSSKRIKKLRKTSGGDTFVIIYLKMQLKAIKTNGMLEYTGLESDFAEELALDLDEEPEDVRLTLTYLLNTGLMESSDNVNFFLPYAVENVGSETAAAQRMREMRERNNVTSMLRERYGEIEKEIEINKEKEEEINQESEIEDSKGEENRSIFPEYKVYREPHDDSCIPPQNINYEGLIRVYLKSGQKDLANHYYQLAKQAGVFVDVLKIKQELNIT